MEDSNGQRSLFSKPEDMWSPALMTLARTDLRAFVLYTMPEYDLQPHHGLMMTAIQETIETPEGRLYMGMPPRHGKSETGTVRCIAWALGRWPGIQIQLLCHSDKLAGSFSLQIRALVRDNPRYREVFPNVVLNKERWQLHDWKTMDGGGLKSVGVRGGITGEGSDLTIIDDPHKDLESPFEEIFEWYVSVARTRLGPGASIILIMTRWDLQDLAGRLLELKDSDTWRSIVLPGLAEEKDILGRKPGDALWPNRISANWMRRQKALDDRLFQALYQNNPRGGDQIMFDVDKIRWIQRASVPAGARFWSCDLATSERDSADYSVLARWVYKSNCLYLIESIRVRETFSLLRERIMNICSKYQSDCIVFPNEVLELLMMKDLRHVVGAGRLKPVVMKGDKVQKAQHVSTLVANRRFRVVSSISNDAFVKELGLFPQGRFDDCVDAAAVAAHWVGIPREFEFFIRGNGNGAAGSN